MEKSKTKRVLIVAADDYGYHEAINRGILAAVKHGIVKSVSVLIGGSGINRLSGEYQKNKTFDIGLHLLVPDENELPSSVVTPTAFLTAFRKQQKRFYNRFHMLPSNYSIHNNASLRNRSIQSKVLSCLYVASQLLEKETGILFRHKLVHHIIPFVANESRQKSFLELKKIIRHLKKGSTIMLTHPALMLPTNKQSAIHSFLSAYPLKKRFIETSILTSPQIHTILKDEQITVTLLAKQSEKEVQQNEN